MEIWKDISGFEGRYQVSSLGRVRSLPSMYEVRSKNGLLFFRLKQARILKQGEHTGGYLTVQLGRGDKRYVHRLVAEAFIQNDQNKPSVNHIDGNKKNNLARNLEWATYSENQDHAKSNGLTPLGEIHPQSKLSDQEVLYIKENYKPFHPEFGAKPLGERFGVAKSIVCRIANGTRRIRV